MPAGRQGFTLVELLIVMAIISTLAALIITSAIIPAQKHSRDTKRKSDLEFIRGGIETFRADCGNYPLGSGGRLGSTLVGVGGSASCPATNVYIQNVPVDSQSPRRAYYYSSDGTTYTICAALEITPTAVGDVSGCGNCGNSGACNYKVTNP